MTLPCFVFDLNRVEHSVARELNIDLFPAAVFDHKKRRNLRPDLSQSTHLNQIKLKIKNILNVWVRSEIEGGQARLAQNIYIINKKHVWIIFQRHLII